MSLRRFFLVAILMIGSCATPTQMRVDPRVLSFGCGDIVVVARIRNETEEPIRIANDLLGHSWFTAALDVKRVVRGGAIPGVLRAKYYQHAPLREDADFMLVLKPGGGSYEIRTWDLMRFRPILANRCAH